MSTRRKLFNHLKAIVLSKIENNDYKLDKIMSSWNDTTIIRNINMSHGNLRIYVKVEKIFPELEVWSPVHQIEFTIWPFTRFYHVVTDLVAEYNRREKLELRKIIQKRLERNAAERSKYREEKRLENKAKGNIIVRNVKQFRTDCVELKRHIVSKRQRKKKAIKELYTDLFWNS